jgi:D-alanyl-D-alanine carboxypeptidase/D-alanyl-D-alanine-endopeptidase (penicillin-binding protein 4)
VKLIYFRWVKQLLNKTLTVKQIAAVIILLLAIAGVTFVFMTGGEDAPLREKVTQQNDSTPETVAATADTSAMGRLLAFIEDSINAATQLRGGTWSFYLGPVDADTAIYEVNASTGLVPASVMKVVTTGTALAVLGPGYRFTTTLQHDGAKEGSTLNGNIYIRGNGDPTLGSETYGSSVEKVVNTWATAIQGLGVDSISGCIIGDAEAFERDMTPGGWCWEDVQSDYGAGPSGLSIHENQFSISLNGSGGHVSMSYTPKIPGMKLYNQCVCNPAIGKSYAYVTGGPYQFERCVQGEVNGHLEARGSIPDPALLCAQLLKQELEQRGIKVGDSATTIRLIRLNGLKLESAGGRKVITSSSSASLRDLVYHTNQVSQNFYAETILRAIGHKQKGYGSTFGGVSAVYAFWKNHNVDLQGMYMVDGSGLSRNNSITTKQLVSMLRVLAKDSVVFPSFYRSLPVAGESGTIRKLADSTAAEGNLRAKSGTMSRVRAYAGYVDTKSGKRMAFAMIGNNTQWELTEIRDKFEKLFVLMAELP